MRLLLVFMTMAFITSLKAQTIFPGIQNNIYVSSLYHNQHLYDSTAKQNWFISKSFGITTAYSFFRGGNAGIIAAPFSFQLNRRINNNLYAFAGVSAAPAYINFRSAFLNAAAGKANSGNSLFKTSNVGFYSGAALGLMYVNDARTFSISGSIGIENNNYPVYYYTPVNARPGSNLPAYR